MPKCQAQDAFERTLPDVEIAKLAPCSNEAHFSAMLPTRERGNRLDGPAEIFLLRTIHVPLYDTTVQMTAIQKLAADAGTPLSVPKWTRLPNSRQGRK